MNVTLSISSTDLSEEDLQHTLRDLCIDINHDTEIRAEVPTQQGELGAKGHIDLAQLTLTFISGGGVVALINVLKSYLERGSRLEMKLEKDGKAFAIKAENVSQQQMGQTIKEASRFFR